MIFIGAPNKYLKKSIRSRLPGQNPTIRAGYPNFPILYYCQGVRCKPKKLTPQGDFLNFIYLYRKMLK